MTETIMFNFDQEVRNVWLKALRAMMKEFPITPLNMAALQTHLQDTYGIRLVMIESGMAGVEIFDPEKAVLFKLRWL